MLSMTLLRSIDNNIHATAIILDFVAGVTSVICSQSHVIVSGLLGTGQWRSDLLPHNPATYITTRTGTGLRVYGYLYCTTVRTAGRPIAGTRG